MTGHKDIEKQRAYTRKWSSENREKTREYDRRRRAGRTPEQIEAEREYQRAYRAKNAERISAARKARREGEDASQRSARLQYHREHYQANREAYVEAQRRWIDANRSRAQEARNAWQRSNPAKRVVNQQNRRARESLGPGVTAKQWEAMLDRFGNHCFFDWCDNKQDIHMSHIIALATGGEHSISNVVPLCATHNLQQGIKDFFDFFDEIERQRKFVV